MRGFAYAAIAAIAMLSDAKAQTVRLLCGFETVTVDIDARTVRVQEASLDKHTSEYKFREFKDGNKHRFFGAQVQDYVSITDASVNYGHDDGLHVNALHYRIDRRTGILASSLYSPATCSSLPVQRIF